MQTSIFKNSRISEILSRDAIRVKARPNAKKTEITEVLPGDILKIKIAAPPVRGRANRALLEYLSGILNVPIKNVIISKGKYKPDKTIKIIRHAV